MKQFVITLFIILSSSLACQAQTYLEHLQKKTPGLGSVTVHQSKDIDELVNGKAVAPQDNNTKTTSQAPLNKITEPQRKTTELQSLSTRQQHKRHKRKQNNHATRLARTPLPTNKTPRKKSRHP